jgi:cell division protein FtsW
MPKREGRVQKKQKQRVLPSEFGRHYDYKLLMVIIVLCCFGLIMIYSSSSYVASNTYANSDGSLHYVKRQGIILILGFFMMLAISKIDYHRLVPFIPIAYLISIVSMILVDFTGLGVEVNGKKRWLQIIPGVEMSRVQPTEFVKLALILLLAFIITKCIHQIDNIRTIVVVGIVTLLSAGLVIINNLSSGIIILGIAFVMFFVASRRKKIYVGVVVAGILLMFFAYFYYEKLIDWKILQPYQLSRIQVWVDPESDPLDKGFQVLQGLYAIGSGGLFGKGLGNSIQKLGFIPESQNDMIFSVICEELGLFGALCLMLLFVYMIYRFVYIALRAPDLFGGLIVVGVMAHIAIQVVLNIAVVTNSIPNTGVTLPFISYGGTSILFLMLEMALVLSVSNQILYEK